MPLSIKGYGWEKTKKPIPCINSAFPIQCLYHRSIFFKENNGDIQLFVSDVKMPGKSGKAAYDEIRAIRPDLKAIFMSGYAEDVINGKMVLDEKLHFISKPISPVEFLRKIRTVLDE